MRRHSFLSILILSCVPLAAFAESEFSGVWTAVVCPSGIKNAPGKCSHFVLELFQKHDKLCGSHVYATPDADQMDEGAGPSLTGTIAGNIATVSVLSGRSPSTAGITAELKMVNGRLRWHRLDHPGRNDLLPTSAQFTRSRAKTLLNPVFAQQLSAACSMISNKPAAPSPTPENAAPVPERQQS